ANAALDVKRSRRSRERLEPSRTVIAPAGRSTLPTPPCAIPDDRGTTQKVTTALIAAATSSGTTLRATKSFQSLNLDFSRAATIAFEPAALTFGSLPMSAAVAVFRLTLAATGAVVPVVEGFIGAAAGGDFAAGADGVPCAKAGAER